MKTIWYSIDCHPSRVRTITNKLKQLGLPTSTKSLTREAGETVRVRLWTCSPHEKTITAMSLLFNDDDDTPVRVFRSLEEAWRACPWDLEQFTTLQKMAGQFKDDDAIVIYPLQRV